MCKRGWLNQGLFLELQIRHIMSWEKRSIQINQDNKVTKYFQSKQGTKLIKIIGFHLIFSLTAFLNLKTIIIVHNEIVLGVI